MFTLAHYLITLLPLLLMAILAWIASLKSNNVTVVDTFWGMFFALSASLSFYFFSLGSSRALLILVLVMIWSFRLSIYLYVRNHGNPEDRRYQVIRARNEPNFRLKSVYLVFLFQAVLAWIISLPIFVSIQSDNPLNTFDYIACLVWLIGMAFEVIGDVQLTAFKSNPDNNNKVLNTGVWRLTRHPNYFGESCIWFGYGVFAVAAGVWWAMVTPILMTYLLVKITGITLLESSINQRRPDYDQYVKTTNSFIPWFPKK